MISRITQSAPMPIQASAEHRSDSMSPDAPYDSIRPETNRLGDLANGGGYLIVLNGDTCRINVVLHPANDLRVP